MSERVPYEQPLLHTPNRWQRTANAFAGVVLCLSTEVTPLAPPPSAQRAIEIQAPAALSGGILPAPFESQRVLPEKGRASCAPINDDSRRVAEKMIDATPTPEVRYHYEQLWERREEERGQAVEGQKANALSLRQLRDYRSLRFNIARDAAQKYGLTVHDPEPYLHSLDADIAANGSSPMKPFADYWRAAEQYLAQFDIKLDLATTDYTGRPIMPKPEELESMYTKSNLYNLIDTMSLWPQEYTGLSGGKQINLMSMDKAPDGASVSGWAYADTHVTEFNIRGYIGARIIAHEDGHHIRAALCGGVEAANNDTVLQSLIHPGRDPSQPPTMQNLSDFFQILKDNAEAATAQAAQGDFWHACALQEEADREIAAVGTMGFLTPYTRDSFMQDGTTAEQGAELAAEVTNTSKSLEVADRRLTLLRAQTIEFVARLHYYRPKLARYVMATHFRYMGTTIQSGQRAVNYCSQ